MMMHAIALGIARDSIVTAVPHEIFTYRRRYEQVLVALLAGGSVTKLPVQLTRQLERSFGAVS